MASGFLKVVGPDELAQRDQQEMAAAEEVRSAEEAEWASPLAAFVRKKFEQFRNHRSAEKLNDRYLFALRSYKGQYGAKKLNEIRQFGGSEVFARMTSIKCRGATALLRDVYVGPDKTWEVAPTPVPELPEDIVGNVDMLVNTEVQTLQQTGQPVPPEALEARRRQLIDAAMTAAQKRAADHASKAGEKLDDLLTEGGFYSAFTEFLMDLPIFPFACIKGPVVQNSTEVKWVEGAMDVQQVPRMFWHRVSPFDVMFSPGANDPEDVEVLERVRFKRADLDALIGVPGYDEDAIRRVLEDYSTGHHEHLDPTDAERADMEKREDPARNQEGVIDGLEFHGTVQGSLLLDFGFTEDQIPDPVREFSVVVWLIGRYVIKVQLNPNPKKKTGYYFTSFEKVPGSLYGSGVPDIIADVQEVGNAAFRSLVNNMSIASGPQVMINEDRISPTMDSDRLYPWKRWRYTNDPLGSSSRNEKPIDFFQPSSNSQELMAVFQKMSDIADEVSAIPRYITGSEKVGGAASTASGLSMLMNNASKVLQNVAASIDRDVMEPLLQDLYHMVMLTDTTGLFRGDEKIRVKGVSVAMQRETERMRKLEFLSLTNNPIDQQIVGISGRAKVLKAIADDLGMPGDDIVPSEQQLMAQQHEMAAQQQAAAQAQGNQPPGMAGPGAGAPERATDNAARTRTPTAVARQAGGGPQPG